MTGLSWPLAHKTGGSTKAPHTATGHRGSGLNILNVRLHVDVRATGWAAVTALFFFSDDSLAVTDSCTEASLWPNKGHILTHIHHFPRWGRSGGEGWGLWKRRAGREGKAPQMKILNQHALPLQLRPRRGLHLIYSPKPGNQAIKRNQTIRFPALNGPTVWCGQPGIRLNPFEVAGERRRQRPSLSGPIYLLALRGCRRRDTQARWGPLDWKVTQCGQVALPPTAGRCWISRL